MSHINELIQFDLSHKKHIIGTDEAGRGSAVGSVYSAAVYFEDFDKKLVEKLGLLNDSKKLSSKRREELYKIIKSETVNATAAIDVDTIEKINILNSSLLGMNQAVANVADNIQSKNILVLVDGCQLIKNLQLEQKYVIKGDSKSASIAAASIIAKVERDRYLIELDEEYPQYNWRKNMGYLTKEHLDAIDKYGLSPYHRKSYLTKHFAKQEQLKLF